MKHKLAFVAAVAAIGLIFTTPAFANGSGSAPVVATNSDSTGPGGSLTVTGNNFYPGEEITLELYSDPVAIGQTNADSAGSFSIVVTIPTDVTPGSHSIVANGSSGDSANTAIVVTGTIVSVTAKIVPAASKSGLPLTGANIAMVSEVGVLAMALGGMLIVSTRRPRRTA